MRPGLILTVVSLVSCAMLFGLPQAEGAETYKGKGVGIIIEKTCLLSSKCLKYSDISNLDNTIPEVSGILVDGNREPTKYLNEYRWYKHSNTFTVAVNPTSGFSSHFPTIQIVTQLREYHLPKQMDILEWRVAPDAHATKQVRSYSHTWYVDATCTNAVISAEHYERLLPQMIYYLQSGCKSNTLGFTNVSVEITDRTQHDITTSQKWKDEQRLKWIKENCLKARNTCASIPQDGI